MIFAGIFVILSCLILGVPAPHGGTRLCKKCDHYVRDPRECMVYHLCHGESCVTEVHFIHNEYLFLYTCKPAHECEQHRNEIVGKKRAPHEHGAVVCRDCCTLHNCQAHEENACSKYFSRTTTPTSMTTTASMTTTTVNDNGCRNYESETFKCSELSKYNFCTDTTSVAYAIAHEKCAKYCGFCNPFGPAATTTSANTVAPEATSKVPATSTLAPAPITTTPAPTTMAPASTTTTPAATSMAPLTDIPALTITMDWTTTNPDSVTPMVAEVNVTAPTDSCKDDDDPSLTCADMLRFGFCDPASGAGYSFAQLRCRKTCQFC